MAERYPGYDVLRKWNSPSWNAKTREVIQARLAIDPYRPQFLGPGEWLTLQAICDRIIPQPPERTKPVPVAAMVDRQLRDDNGGGYRDFRLPPPAVAWKLALAAFDAEAMGRHSRAFHLLSVPEQNDLLRAAQEGAVNAAIWGDLSPPLFFSKRLLHDIVTAYYTHPIAWNEIGFGGPASPRGYVRMDFDTRDPWEAAAARPGREAEAERKNDRIR